MNTGDASTYTVSKWLDDNLVTVVPSSKVSEVAKIMRQADVGAVLVTDDDAVLGVFSERDMVNRVIGAGLAPESESVESHMTTEIITIDKNAQPDDALAIMLKRNIRHIPVLDEGRLIGMISSRDLLRRYYNLLDQQYHDLRRKASEMEKLLSVSSDDRLAQVLEQNNKLRQLAMTDELTGLYNNRHFQQRLFEEIERAKRYNYPVSLLFADVDYFKQYNDTNGHVEGDNALRSVGRILQNFSMEIHISAKLRKTDIVARYGGEEFVVLLPYTAADRAIEVGERLRKTVEDYPFKNEETLPGKNLTVSIGVADFPGLSGSSEELIRHADAALYHSKSTGRNKVSVYNKT